MSALTSPSATPDDAQESIRAAELAALNLWNHLDTLRHNLSSSGTKRKRTPPATPSIPTTTLWHQMQLHESTSLPNRRSTLEKWSAKLRPIALLPPSRKLINSPTTHTLTAVLDDHLSTTNSPRLLARTRTPRSCAPLQAQSGMSESVDIFDDADFYTLLLKELVDQRMADTSLTSSSLANGIPTLTTTMKGAEVKVKTRKKVDTKASKGRKMRYTVHEKLQNFMASEDRGRWGGRQVDELFGGLLGVRVGLGEGGEDGDGGSEGEHGERDGEDGLRLFRN
ncbi:MAG: rRNA-processing protein bfr2 [Pleopsidium flavum]|nr:MAG: rRNA-processing protein bfr2 [Pleopsidium flavum]